MPVSLALWLCCTALLPEENTLQGCVKTVSITLPFPPRDTMGDVPCVLMELMLSVLCSVHPEARYKGRICLTHTGRCGAGLGKRAGGEGRAQEL